MNSFYKSYIGTSERERTEMLQELGKKDILELFSEIPSNLLLKDDLDLPGPFSESQLTNFFLKIASKNITPQSTTSFLGGGVRQLYIPAALEELMRRGELYTSYTPYQPEISQGMLQLSFEYQSMVAELLDMEVVNSSMYDWASALGEVIRIMYRITKRKRIILAHPISENRIAVAQSYVKHTEIKLEILPSKDGNVDTAKLIEIFTSEANLDKKSRSIAGLYFEIPNYFGTLPSKIDELVDVVHQSGALFTSGVDAISLGIIRPPGAYDADFVVGEGQILGNPPSMGGPLLGILASKYNKKWIRQIPGRLIGETVELTSDRKGYCMTLVTREQHIRREKATSNICTNQAITAVNAAIYLAALGKEGVKELAQSLMDRAHYLASLLDEIEGVKAPIFDHPFFCEFVIEVDGVSDEKLETHFHKSGIVPGHKIVSEKCRRLISVNELHTKEDLEKFVKVMKEVL